MTPPGRWCPVEAFGWAAVVIGGTVAPVAAGVCIALQLLKDVL